MKFPTFLNSHDAIAVPAPSAGISIAEIKTLKSAVNKLEKLKHPVILTKNYINSNLHISASEHERANNFMQMWLSDGVKALISLAGGEFMIKILPCLNRHLVINSTPKWFQGFSDNTVLTYFLTVMCDISSIYHYNFLYFGMKNWHKSVKDSLKFLHGEKTEFVSFNKHQATTRKIVEGKELDGFKLTKKVKWQNLNGINKTAFSGRLIGGCLDILVCLCGTGFDYTKDFIKKYYSDGFVWYLETYDLTTPETLRALWQLKKAGWFENVKGFIFGRPTVNQAFKGWSYNKAVLSELAEFDVPILVNCDVGHIPPTIPMVNGAIVNVVVNNCKSKLWYLFKE